MNNHTAFIFDMDGTLVDNMAYHIQSWLALLVEQGYTLSEDDYHHRFSGKTNAEILRELLGQALSAAAIHTLGERKEEHYRTLYRPYIQPIWGLTTFLDEATRLGIPLAVATAAGQRNIEFVLGETGLAPYFQAVVGAEDVLRGKPEPDLFLAAANRLGVTPRQCLVFEDAPGGIEAARRANMDAAVLLTAISADVAHGFAHVIASAPDYTGWHPSHFALISGVAQGNS